MTMEIDNEILQGLLAEVRAYLPQIRSSLFEEAEAKPALAHRMFHNIHGASSMVGLHDLSAMSALAEASLDGIETIEASRLKALATALDIIESHLSDLASGTAKASGLEQVQEAFVGFDFESPSGDGQATRSASAGATPANWLEREDGAGDLGGSDALEGIEEAFRYEAADHLQHIEAALRLLAERPEHAEGWLALQRRLHTLKGAGSMSGFVGMGHLAHRMEDLIEAGAGGGATEVIDLLQEASDTLASGLESDGSWQPEPTLIARLEAWLPKPVDREQEADLRSELGDPSDRQAGLLVSRSLDAPTGVIPQGDTVAEDTIRIPLSKLDEMVRLLADLVFEASALDDQQGELRGEVDELTRGVERVRAVSRALETDYEVAALWGGTGVGPRAEATAGSGQDVSARTSATSTMGRASEFDELELDRYSDFHLLSRALAEAGADLHTSSRDLLGSSRDARAGQQRVRRLSGQIQDRLLRLRMVPFSTLVPRLRRTVRVTARERSKEVLLTLAGESIELDKRVVDALADPLLHLLRNAVDHGIESPDERRRQSKEPRGRIHLDARAEGGQIVLELQDDGAGIDFDRAIAAAIELGLINADEAETLSASEARDLIFRPGLSTASEVSEISGRGVGLDIVRSTVQELKGSLEVRSSLGVGTLFRITLPSSLALSRVLLIQTSGQVVAVPLVSIDRVVPLSAEDHLQLAQGSYDWAGDVTEVVALSSLLGQPRDAELGAALVLQGAQKRALLVEKTLGAREVVARDPGPLVSALAGVAGATVLGDGRAALILEPSRLFVEGYEIAAQALPELPPDQALKILIVDDSLSIRRILSGLAENSGWRPTTARDGLEALEILHETEALPNAILLDVEMPRMDGYELTTTIRSTPAFSGIPIIMLTSRSAEKHRRRALDLGVDEYLIKPYQQDVLVDVVERLARRGT